MIKKYDTIINGKKVKANYVRISETGLSHDNLYGAYLERHEGCDCCGEFPDSFISFIDELIVAGELAKEYTKEKHIDDGVAYYIREDYLKEVFAEGSDVCEVCFDVCEVCFDVEEFKSGDKMLGLSFCESCQWRICDNDEGCFERFAYRIKGLTREKYTKETIKKGY